jgi:N-acylneuraminate cytidylyltransferase/CMP-N,N'-diacetyllegionaminic acid synthase
MIAGRPLIAHTVQQLLDTGLFDQIAISSDSDSILEVARAAGADILIKRPDELATDSAAKLPVIQHCFAQVEAITGKTFSHLIDLDATAPLRSVADIVAVTDLLKQHGTTNVITASPARRSPYFNLVECDENGVPSLSKPPKGTVVRRQDAPKCYDMNASIYGWTRAALFDQASLFAAGTRLYVMPEERSVDIDSELDFQFVEMLMNARLRTEGAEHA